ncbi:2-oxoacid:acceptor oxidoreductase family protein [bacterium]|nr:2-oxoacid:acceptor oxidoreductase family protein [bacterium]MBU1651871.1 2-oxoacid:acceptor oxidoreductase family protein [bacterium]
MIKGRYEARFSAVGGQGVLLAGDILALAAQKYEGRFAVQSPTYTAQVRGGPTKIDVIIDDEPVVYPKTTAIDFFLSMAQGSYDAFFYDIKDDAIVVIDPNLVPKWKEGYTTYRVPIIELTKVQIGKMVMSSVLSLGIMVELTGIVSKEAVEKALLDKAPKGTEELNLKAINIGFEQAKLLKAGK